MTGARADAVDRRTRVPAGHALRLAVSPTYWPWIWPSPEPVTLTVTAAGSSCRCAAPSALDAALRPFGRARVGRRARRRSHSRRARRAGSCTRDLATGAADVEFAWIDHRTRHHRERHAARRAQRRRTTGSTEGDPLSAAVRVRGRRRARARRLAHAREVRSADDLRRASAFLVTTELDAYEGGGAPLRAPLDARDPAGRRMRTATPLVLVRGSRDRAARARPDLPARVAVRGPARGADRARLATSPTHVGGLPVVLTRDRDDVLRAFANVCRHRGSIVARGAGERGTLQCPYHAWTYGLDGCLRAAPRTKDDPGFALDGLGLRAAGGRHAGARSCSSTRTRTRRRSPRRSATCPAVVARARARRRRAALPPPRRVRDPGELEDRARELPRVLPLPAQPPGPRLGDRRPPADDGGARAAREPVQPARTRTSTSPAAIAAGPVPPAVPVAEGQRRSPARRTSRSARSGRSRRTAAAATSTTSSRPDASEEWIAEFLAFDDQVGAEDTALVEGAQAGAGSGLVAGGPAARPRRAAHRPLPGLRARGARRGVAQGRATGGSRAR